MCREKFNYSLVCREKFNYNVVCRHVERVKTLHRTVGWGFSASVAETGNLYEHSDL
jgi:hypothetical protein